MKNINVFGSIAQEEAQPKRLLSNITLDEFIARAKKMIKSGVMRYEGLAVGEDPLTERDYAISYTLGRLMEEGRGSFFSFDDIYYGIRTYCGEEVLNRIFKHEAEGQDE